jgi:hypothetical protein
MNVADTEIVQTILESAGYEASEEMNKVSCKDSAYKYA